VVYNRCTEAHYGIGGSRFVEYLPKVIISNSNCSAMAKKQWSPPMFFLQERLTLHQEVICGSVIAYFLLLLFFQKADVPIESNPHLVKSS